MHVCNYIPVFPLRRCLCNAFFWSLAIKTLGLIFIYYIFSIGLTFYQKWFIKDFHFPLSVVICHLVVKFVLALLLRETLECLMKLERVTLSWSVYVKSLSGVGIASALDIGLSNWSFEFITLSLYTMSKTTCIIFILIFSLIFGLEKLQCSLIVVVSFISVGLFLFTYHSTQFNVEGFALVMSASFTGGLRWTLAQLVMQKKEVGLSNPVDMVYHIQPWMILGILPFAIAIEGLPLAMSKRVFRAEDLAIPFQTAMYILIGATLAFLMELSEFLLLSFTSSLTLSIAGIFKEVCIMYFAWWFHGDVINFLNGVGLFISLMGISLHVFFKAVQSGNSSHSADVTKVPLLHNDADEDVLFEMSDLVLDRATSKF